MVVSEGVVAYLQRMEPNLLRAAPTSQHGGSFATKPLWIAVAVLAVLTPLGILAGGSAWGEWSIEDFLRPQTRQQIAAASAGQAPPAQPPARTPNAGTPTGRSVLALRPALLEKHFARLRGFRDGRNRPHHLHRLAFRNRASAPQSRLYRAFSGEFAPRLRVRRRRRALHGIRRNAAACRSAREAGGLDSVSGGGRRDQGFARDRVSVRSCVRPGTAVGRPPRQARQLGLDPSAAVHRNPSRCPRLYSSRRVSGAQHSYYPVPRPRPLYPRCWFSPHRGRWF